jgi:hypothetical protein
MPITIRYASSTRVQPWRVLSSARLDQTETELFDNEAARQRLCSLPEALSKPRGPIQHPKETMK